MFSGGSHPSSSAASLQQIPIRHEQRGSILHQLGRWRAQCARQWQRGPVLTARLAADNNCPPSWLAHLKNLQIVANLSHMKQSTQKAVMAASSTTLANHTK